MRSDAIDQLVGNFLKQPVKMSWEGSTADAVFGSFEGARLELAGVATAWLSLERVVLDTSRASIRPGVPPKIQIEGGTMELAVGQSEIDRWVSRFQLPFRLQLNESGLAVKTEIAGLPVTEFETRLDVVNGWFVLQPKRASFLGVPGWVPSMLRSYLPLPPLSEGVGIQAIGHEPGLLTITFAVEDFEESITPGLVDRLRRRVLPFLR